MIFTSRNFDKLLKIHLHIFLIILIKYTYKAGVVMYTLIGISVRGTTYFFLNTFSRKELLLLKKLSNNYRMNTSLFNNNNEEIIKQFILDANILLNISLQLVNIEEILIIK